MQLDAMFPHLIHIGADCTFAPQAVILAHDASSYSHTGQYFVSPVHIGDGVFVGYGAIIMPGVTIGSRAIVGAGSVVTKDVPAGSVVAGVPARVLGSVEDTVRRRDASRMYSPPYAGKRPSEVTREDVLAFRQLVYLREAPEENPRC
jgi:maltose O-acetyltransferase